MRSKPISPLIQLLLFYGSQQGTGKHLDPKTEPLGHRGQDSRRTRIKGSRERCWWKRTTGPLEGKSRVDQGPHFRLGI